MDENKNNKTDYQISFWISIVFIVLLISFISEKNSKKQTNNYYYDINGKTYHTITYEVIP